MLITRPGARSARPLQLLARTHGPALAGSGRGVTNDTV
jgi:hypothetical protein